MPKRGQRIYSYKRGIVEDLVIMDALKKYGTTSDALRRKWATMTREGRPKTEWKPVLREQQKVREFEDRRCLKYGKLTVKQLEPLLLKKKRLR